VSRHLPRNYLCDRDGGCRNILALITVPDDDVQMSNVDDRRKSLQEVIRNYSDPALRVKRAYFDRPSMALKDKHDIEFDIKAAVSDRYKVPFRSVVFTGSAQLGFSPHKDTEFAVGKSDLDIAVIDGRLYQEVWEVVLRRSDGFNNLSAFHSEEHRRNIQTHMLKRAMILLDFMPRCEERSREQLFLDQLSVKYRRIFGRVSLAVYMSEAAFCRKQVSALSNVMGFRKNAE